MLTTYVGAQGEDPPTRKEKNYAVYPRKQTEDEHLQLSSDVAFNNADDKRETNNPKVEWNRRPELQTVRVNVIQIVEPQLRRDWSWTSKSTVRTGRNAVGEMKI